MKVVRYDPDFPPGPRFPYPSGFVMAYLFLIAMTIFMLIILRFWGR